jgi:hypothetical protein
MKLRFMDSSLGSSDGIETRRELIWGQVGDTLCDFGTRLSPSIRINRRRQLRTKYIAHRGGRKSKK